MARLGHAGPARAVGPPAKGGQSDPGGAGGRTAELPAGEPYCGPVPQRLLHDAGEKPCAHAGAGDRPAGAGMAASYGGGGVGEPPSGAVHRRGNREPVRPNRPRSGCAERESGLGPAGRPILPAGGPGRRPGGGAGGRRARGGGAGRGVLLRLRGDVGRAAGGRGVPAVF